MLEYVMNNALISNLQLLGEKAKNRIEDKFPVCKRKDMLISILRDECQNLDDF